MVARYYLLHLQKAEQVHLKVPLMTSFYGGPFEDLLKESPFSLRDHMETHSWHQVPGLGYKHDASFYEVCQNHRHYVRLEKLQFFLQETQLKFSIHEPDCGFESISHVSVQNLKHW